MVAIWREERKEKWRFERVHKKKSESERKIDAAID